MSKSSQQALKSNLSVLRDEYRALRPHDRERHSDAAKSLDEIFELINDEVEIITHDHIRSASRLLIELIHDEKLEFRAMQIRKVLHDLTNTSPLSESFENDLDNFSDLPTEKQRAAVGELQRVRSAASIDTINASIFKADIINTSFALALALMATCILILFFLVTFNNKELALFLFAAFFGIFGAWISTASRIRDTNPQALARHAELNTAQTSSIWISPLFGAIGACLIFGGLQTGIIGKLTVATTKDTATVSTPKETVAAAITKNTVTVATEKDPEGFIEHMCSYFLGFLSFLRELTSKENIGSTFLIALTSLAAGWSERLVPDMLEWAGTKIRPNATK